MIDFTTINFVLFSQKNDKKRLIRDDFFPVKGRTLACLSDVRGGKGGCRMEWFQIICWFRKRKSGKKEQEKWGACKVQRDMIRQKWGRPETPPEPNRPLKQPLDHPHKRADFHRG